MTKMIAFQIALGTDFDRFWAPTWSPNRPRISHIGAKIGPRPPQDPSKTSQNPLKSSPKSIQNRNLIFDPFWNRILLIFHRFSTPTSTKNQSKSIKKHPNLDKFWSPTCLISKSISKVTPQFADPGTGKNHPNWWATSRLTIHFAKLSHSAPKARAGDDPPQAPSIDR